MTDQPFVDARRLLELLAQRHSKDIFVPECKNGPTVGVRGLRKLDAWAMKRSWAHVHTWGYEIKVTRSDFLRDEKWRETADLCHAFSFVCPWEMIKTQEVPQGVGLIYATSGGGRLLTRIKAPRRDIEMPVELLCYVLMARARIVDLDRWESEADYWRRWMREKSENLDLGHRVSKRLWEVIHGRLHDAERRANNAMDKARGLEEADRILKRMGITPGCWGIDELIRRKINLLQEAVPQSLIDQIKATRDRLDTLVGRLLEERGEEVAVGQASQEEEFDDEE